MYLLFWTINLKYIMGIGDWGLGIGDWGLGIGVSVVQPFRAFDRDRKYHACSGEAEGIITAASL